MAKKIAGVTKMAMGIIARNEIEAAKQQSLASKLRRLGDRWRLFKESIRSKRYFIRTLKEVGILRFGDRIRIMFARDVGRIQMEIIDRLSKAYEEVFFSDSYSWKRSSAGDVDKIMRGAQDMINGPAQDKLSN
jgi:hypothetical protein